MKKIIACALLVLTIALFTGCSITNDMLPTRGDSAAETLTDKVASLEEVVGKRGGNAKKDAAEDSKEAEPAQKGPMSPADLAEYTQACTVTINVQMHGGGEGAGSGFFIDDEGTIATSYHVIDSAESISVALGSGGSYEVTEIIDFSEMYDIALLKIDYNSKDHLKFAKETGRTGETVYAVGSSLGFLDGTFSDGIISNSSRKVGSINCIQTTAAISHGNSGGPLVNEYGEVIGINAFSYENGESLNLAVKASMLDELAKNKNWNLNQYREWYKKEIDRSYKVWNYSTKEYELSKINTYQHVTGSTCIASDYDWDLVSDGDYSDVAEGYVEDMGVFFYLYDADEFDQYTEYLNSIGFTFVESKDYTNGISYYYENEFSGYRLDMFIEEGSDGALVIEPYCN